MATASLFRSQVYIAPAIATMLLCIFATTGVYYLKHPTLLDTVFFLLRGLPAVLIFIILLFSINSTTSIVVDEDTIIIRRCCGIGNRQKFSIGDFDGFKLLHYEGRGKKYEAFCFIKNGKTVLSFGQNHIANYQQVKNALGGKIRNIL